MIKTIKIGIYLIENSINHKKYIGQSKNIYVRWNNHRSDSKIKNLPLYQAMRKYGIENFTFSILEECDIQNLAEREDYWINFYNSYVPNGYNINKAETHGTNLLIPEKILNIIDEIENSYTKLIDIAKKYELSKSQINRINQGKSWRLTNKEYPLRGHQELQIATIQEMIKNNFSISEIAITFSTTTATIKGFLRKNNIKVSDIREPLTSSQRIKITELDSGKIFHFRKKIEAAEWMHNYVNNNATAQSHLSNLTYHLNNKKPYQGYLIEYDRAEVEE